MTTQAQAQLRPLFIYGTLCAMPLLAWALTGDAKNVDAVSTLAQPATVVGFERLAVKGCDYPAIVRRENSSVQGFLLRLDNTSQRKKLDDFEGELYKVTPVDAHIIKNDEQETVEADMYLWDGQSDALAAMGSGKIYQRSPRGLVGPL
jgi:gamma-glutamylcyclotransferase (GGCT)/AIG2-like uncharacterized protein YtfP